MWDLGVVLVFHQGEEAAEASVVQQSVSCDCWCLFISPYREASWLSYLEGCCVVANPHDRKATDPLVHLPINNNIDVLFYFYFFFHFKVPACNFFYFSTFHAVYPVYLQKHSCDRMCWSECMFTRLQPPESSVFWYIIVALLCQLSAPSSMNL